MTSDSELLRDLVAREADGKVAPPHRLKPREQRLEFAVGDIAQVGGAVARERLCDALEAFELAERQEKEVEEEYEGWKLLLEQMKEADRDQASNLGQALAPAIAGRFRALTERRYENVRLTADLGTEGVVVASQRRSKSRRRHRFLSAASRDTGTGRREQLRQDYHRPLNPAAGAADGCGNPL